jgi:hypothetical protein
MAAVLDLERDPVERAWSEDLPFSAACLRNFGTSLDSVTRWQLRLAYQTYRALDKQISDLESAIKGKRDVTTMFSQLRDKIAAFLKRQRDRERD